MNVSMEDKNVKIVHECERQISIKYVYEYEYC